MKKTCKSNKIINLSICYFTIATEYRFNEIDQKKSVSKNDKALLDSEDFKKSEIYHLKVFII
jgi:hypothetical protein